MLGTYSYDFPDPPRFMQTITGDFTVSAKIHTEGDRYFNSTGLLLWSDADNYITLTRYQGNSSSSDNLTFGKMQNGVYGAVASILWPSGTAPFYLKLQRTGSQVIASYSSDGASWTQLGASNTTLPGTI